MAKKLSLSILVVGVFFFISLSLPLTVSAIIGLPQTGQQKCFGQTQTEWNEISCTDTGQDGELRSGVAWPDPRFTLTYCDEAGPCTDQAADCDGNASSDVITDNLTGLMWARDSNLPGVTLTWQQALDFAINLDTGGGLCGHHDWRMPNILEIESLYNYDEGAFDASMSVGFNWLINYGFNYVPVSDYWSSTTEISKKPIQNRPNTYANTIQPGQGIGLNSKNTNYAGFWLLRTSFDGAPAPVRRTGQKTCYDVEGVQVYCSGTGQDGDIQAGQPWPGTRLTDNGNDTVTDNLTGLMWTKKIYSPGPAACNPFRKMSWIEALDFVKCLNRESYLGFSNWRLPNIRELLSLLDFGSMLPPLPNKGRPFMSMRGEDFYRWSSTMNGLRFGGSFPWFLFFLSGWGIGSNHFSENPHPLVPVRTPDFSLCVYAVDPATQSFAYRGKKSSIRLQAFGEVGCPTPEIVTAADWITVSIDKWERNEGKGRMTALSNTSALERTAEVIIGKDITMTVTQEGAPCKFVSVSPKNLSVDPSSSTGSFDVKITPQDCAWSATESSDWIAITAGSGTGNGIVSFTIDANSTVSNRTGNITVYLNNDPKKKKVFTIKQMK